MDSGSISVTDLVLHCEETGEEVGYPDVKLVGLYSNQNVTYYYYIDLSNFVVLDVFQIVK